MRRNPVSFALTVGMALIVVLFGFTLLSAAGLTGFAATDALASQQLEVPQDTILLAGRVSTPAPQLTAVQAAEVAAGDALFKGNCAQCHAVNEPVVGPALAGITKRRPLSWILPWVKNSSKLVASGDEYAVAVFNKYGKQQMPSFALSDKEIASIVAYLNASEAPAVAMAGTVAAR